MALVESIPIPLGTPLPPFSLRDPKGTLFSSDRLGGEKGLLVVITCNHCPYAQAVWPRLIRLARDFQKLGVETVAINPNIHPDYPEDRPEAMQEKIQAWGIFFPYLVDEAQEVASALQAQCTPDIYLYDGEKKLVYHGRIDDNWQDEAKVTVHDLRDAVSCLAAGQPVSQEQFPSMGCSIKWR